MREIYEQLCKDSFTATEAYTNNHLGVIHKLWKGGHGSSREVFWIGCLENWYDRIVEIRFRRDEMPEVYFLTENSKKVLGKQ